MQELIEELKEEIAKQNKNPSHTPRGNVYNLAISKAIELATDKLPKEKEQMIDFAYECTQHISREDIEQYYNKKVNQKQHIIDIMKSDEEGGLYKQEKEEALSFLVKQAQELDLGYEEFELGGEG